MKEVFGAIPRSRIALETGMHSPWVRRALSELGHEVIVAHARNVRLIGGSRKKDDRIDAQTLARLARIDPQLLCPVKHRSARAQADLTVIRARAGLVRARTALVNTARGLAKSYGERLRGCNVRNMNPEKAEGLSPELRTALEPLLAGIESLSERIRECNERIERLAQESSPANRLVWRSGERKQRPEEERAYWRQSMRLVALAWPCSFTCSTERSRDLARAVGLKKSSAYGSMPASD
jgi:transposase